MKIHKTLFQKIGEEFLQGESKYCATAYKIKSIIKIIINREKNKLQNHKVIIGRKVVIANHP